MKFFQTTTARWLLVVLVMAAIFVGSSTPEPEDEWEILGTTDKLLHWVVYAFLGWALYRATKAGDRRSEALCAAAAVLIAALYGVSDEFHQSFVPGRDVSSLDWAADVLGAATAAAILYIRSAREVRRNG